MEDSNGRSDLTVLSFRKLDDVRRLARHFRYIIEHPQTQANPILHKYLKSLDETHRRIFLQKREYVEVEYIFGTEKKSNLQRQRFNSLPVSEVPELLKAELLTAENAKQVHICTDCDAEIELHDEEPLMESLQKHFSLPVHLPKMKRESVDVSEPIHLPNMSRRLSAITIGESHSVGAEAPLPAHTGEKLDRNFRAKLSDALAQILPEDEAGVAAALELYQEAHDALCRDMAAIDFTALTGSVAPIIMSIRDNVYQNFAADSNKNTETDDAEHAEKPRTQAKKYRHYGPIEALILRLLADHKLLSLVDDRTGKLAFFCIACEYYTLRFHYDSVLGHVFGDTHVHNLSSILGMDARVPFAVHAEPTLEAIRKMNENFLLRHEVVAQGARWHCRLCAAHADSPEQAVLHVLDERHLARLSDELYMRAKRAGDGAATEDWGPKDLNWAKFLASSGKPQPRNDHVIVENFIKPSGKVGNYCTCCDMTLKGPRQVLFNHIRQKKHLRNAAPHKLTALYKNHCRPAEYYASFGNFYVCAICPEYVAVPSYAAIVEHFEGAAHLGALAGLLRAALRPAPDPALLRANHLACGEGAARCELCELTFPEAGAAVRHALSAAHGSAAAAARAAAHRGDIIAVYMRGHYILHSEGASFTCVPCAAVFNSIRSLLTHLVYADHFESRPPPESVFRFYLELKHNINMLARNKYVYYEFGALRCGVCDADVDEGENAKRHVVSARHRENMGASYVTMDTSAVD